MAHDIFRNDAGHEKVEEVIAAAGFSTAAAHFESAKRMTTDNCAGAGAIPGKDVGICPGIEGREGNCGIGGIVGPGINAGLAVPCGLGGRMFPGVEDCKGACAVAGTCTAGGTTL